MLPGWTSKDGLRWFAYSPNMTSGQHTHRPFNRLICKHHDVICVERRTDPFKAKTQFRGLLNVSSETYFWANLISPRYEAALPLADVIITSAHLLRVITRCSLSSLFDITAALRRGREREKKKKKRKKVVCVF